MMDASAPTPKETLEGPQAFAFLDDLLQSEIDARLIALGIRLGWFDAGAIAPRSFDQMSANAQRLATTRLAALQLWEKDRPGVPGARLAAFTALRELIEARLWFLFEIAPDFSSVFELFLGDGIPLVQRAKLFRLFDYSAALRNDADAQERTARWVRYTTVLTEIEGPDIARRCALDSVSRLVDVGGNSGAFGLALLRQFPKLNVEVFDLPGVCAVGRQYALGRPASERLRFTSGDLRVTDIPSAEVICFKSVLHDWPADMVSLFLKKSAEALPPDGRLFIVEREAPDFAPGPDLEKPGFSQLANFAFLPFYRSAEAYLSLVEGAGLGVRRRDRFVLDGPFILIEAVKGR